MPCLNHPNHSPLIINHAHPTIKISLGRHAALPLHAVPFYIGVEKPWHAMPQPRQPLIINNLSLTINH